MLRYVLVFLGIAVLYTVGSEVPGCPPCSGKWTTFYSVDNGTYNDDETLKEIRKQYHLCPNPIGIDARLLNGLDYTESGDTVTIGPKFGLLCLDEDQKSGECEDYKVRFCCPEEKDDPPCDGHWTRYFNIETLDEIQTQFPTEVCQHPNDIDARLAKNGMDYSTSGEIVTVGQSFGLICKGSEQADMQCEDYKVRFCCKEEPKEPYCAGRWTEFFQTDDPDSDGGDVESLSHIQQEYPGDVCDCPIGVDARLEDGMDYTTSGDIVSVGRSYGISCLNSDQMNKTCENYKVRFCCKQDPPCAGEWTRYFNRDKPTLKYDNEQFRKIRHEYPHEVCKHPVGIDARLANGLDISTSGDSLAIGATYGLTCRNSDQKDGKCADYEVRFCCQKEFFDPPCDGYWTHYFNTDTPNNDYDSETLYRVRHAYPNSVCSHPSAIDVVVVGTGKDYLTTGEIVTVGPTYGFSCKNSIQHDHKCENYKVRFCCPQHQG